MLELGRDRALLLQLGDRNAKAAKRFLSATLKRSRDWIPG
jgi:hypothetical protein